MRASSLISRAVALVGAMVMLPGWAGATLTGTLTATIAAGQPIQLSLLVTNSGLTDVTNVAAQAWTAGAAAISAPTASSTSYLTLYAGQDVTFAWTATPSAAGAITFTASATGDGPDSTTPDTAGGTVAAANAVGQLTWSRTYANVGQGTQVMLTVSSTGGATLTNVIPQISVLGPAAVSVPVPLTSAAVVAGQQKTFVWTITATGAGTIAYTANASADGPVVTVLNNGSLSASASPLAAKAFLATPGALWAGQTTVLSMTVSNVGGAAVGNPSARVWGNLKATGLPGAGFSASAKAVTSLGVNATVVFTWTIPPSVAGLLTSTGTPSGDGGSYGSAVSLTVTVYAATAMRARLGCEKPGVAGAPVQFLMSLTNTGAMTIVNLTAALWSDSVAAVGASTPATVATLVPGAQTSFVWTVTASDARAMNFYAVANGFTTSATGAGVAAASNVAATTLAGIPAPGAKAAFVYPSPARDAANVAYTMAEAGKVTIRVYSEIGDLVATVEEVKTAGVWSSPLTTSGLAPGVYYLLVEKKYDSGTSEKAGMKKFVVVH